MELIRDIRIRSLTFVLFKHYLSVAELIIALARNVAYMLVTERNAVRVELVRCKIGIIGIRICPKIRPGMLVYA